MIALFYLLGLIGYIGGVILSYSDNAKAAPWYFYVGLTLSTLCGFLWMYIAKVSTGNQTYLRGVYWDSMIMGVYLILPVLFYHVKLPPIQILGVVLVALGIILTKING